MKSESLKADSRTSVWLSEDLVEPVLRQANGLGLTSGEWVRRAIRQVLGDGLRNRRVTLRERARLEGIKGQRTEGRSQQERKLRIEN